MIGKPEAETEIAVSDSIYIRPVELLSESILVEVESHDSFLGRVEVKADPLMHKAALEAEAEELSRIYKMPVVRLGFKEYEANLEGLYEMISQQIEKEPERVRELAGAQGF